MKFVRRLVVDIPVSASYTQTLEKSSCGLIPAQKKTSVTFNNTKNLIQGNKGWKGDQGPMGLPVSLFGMIFKINEA